VVFRHVQKQVKKPIEMARCQRLPAQSRALYPCLIALLGLLGVYSSKTFESRGFRTKGARNCVPVYPDYNTDQRYFIIDKLYHQC